MSAEATLAVTDGVSTDFTPSGDIFGEGTNSGAAFSRWPKPYTVSIKFILIPAALSFCRKPLIWVETASSWGNSPLDHIWPSGEFPQEDAVSTQIKGLRQKLKAVGMSINLIETVYGLGYRLKAAPDFVPSPKISPEAMKTVETPSQTVSVASADKLQAQAKVQAVLEQVWGKFQEVWKAQLIEFEQACALLSTGTLKPELLSSSLMGAHRLIGTLGSVGLPKGSEVARKIEQLLRSDSLSKNEAGQLENLVEQLKQIIKNKPSTKATIPDVKIASGRLLLVDDDVVLTEQIKREAQTWGFQVEVATNPTAARKLISSQPPDVVVLDLSFTDTKENGLILLAEVAQRTPSIPVLVLTARNQLSERVEVARLGGNMFLEKPISPEEIIKVVAQELNRTQKPEAKILIVDDDRVLLIVLSNLLTPWGFQVITLADPQQFWQTLQTSAPDLLILDIEMPNFSGIELCQVVRRDPRWSELPVLFLSGHHDPDIVHQVFAVGADDYIQKPIVGPELIARILNRLERTRILHRFAEIDELTGTATRRKSVQDLEGLLRLAKHQNQPLCFMILDLDHFKQVNDRHGHEVGDFVLGLFGKRLKGFFRSEDIIARWGGEEFILGLYAMTREEGAKRMTNFLLTWCQQAITAANNQTLRVALFQFSTTFKPS